MDSRHAGIEVVKPQLVQRDEVLVMGVEVRTAHQREMNSTTAEIPKLWNRFLAEQLWLGISESINTQILYGIYTNYDCQQFGEYSAIVAVEVSSIDNPSENMVGITLPAGRYLLFRAGGSSPEAIKQTWQQIWDYFSSGSPHQRAFTIDFEQYESEQVSIYISIK
jgi:predicted transcriptional regulator YdeE